MSIYTTNRLRVCILVDWRSALHGLKSKYGAASPVNSSQRAAQTLVNLKAVVLRIPQPPDLAISIDTLIFGGFTASDGSVTPELATLRESISGTEWQGIAAERFHFRTISPICGLRPGTADDSLPGLFRADSPILEAQLQLAGEQNPCCNWSRLTQVWLSSHENGERCCPECQGKGKSVKALLIQRQQKIVDVLLSSYAFEAARRFTRTDDEGPGQIWICSTDADFVPVLATVGRWGVRALWLQPQPNRGFGYRRDLEQLGIDVYDAPSLLDGR